MKFPSVCLVALMLAPTGFGRAVQTSVDADVPEVVVLFDALIKTCRAPGQPSTDALLLVEFGRHPRTELLRFLEERIEVAPLPGEREAALLVLGELGAGPQVHLLLQLAVWPDQPVPTRGLRNHVERQLGRILGRHPDAVWYLQEVFTEAPPGLGSVVARTIADTGSRDGLEVLANLLGQVPDVDVHLLTAIGRHRKFRPMSERVLDNVRGCLAGGDPARIQAAALALGQLQDLEAVPELILHLRGRTGYPGSGAYRALREITHLDLGRDPEPWERWYRQERAWWAHESSDAMARLRTGEPTEVTRIVLDFSRRGLFRDEVSRALTVCLDRREPELVQLTCTVLGRLGSMEAVHNLVKCLEHPDEGVRGATLTALQEITGLELGPDAQAWWMALEEPRG